MVAEPSSAVFVSWSVNPFRGDRFEEMWTPHAEAAMRYGARGWAFFRSADDPLRFTQIAFFDSHDDWDRYWYGEELSSAREEAVGLFQVPVAYVWQTVVGLGRLELSQASAD